MLAQSPRTRLGILVAMVIAAVMGAIVWQFGSRSVTRNAALEQARSGNFPTVEAELRLAWERDSTDAEVAEQLARGYLAAENREECERYLFHWAELRPESLEPQKLLYEFHRKNKNWDKALTSGLALQKLAPAEPQLRRSLVGHAFDSGQFEIAEKLCRELLSEQPNNPGFRTTLAAIRRARGDATDSAAILDEVIQAHPQFVPALADRAAAYEEAGEPLKAIPMLREVLKLDPQRQRSAGYRLSMALDRTGQTEEARKVLAEVRRLQDVSTAEEAIKNQPYDAALRVRLGESLLQAGHTADGVRVVQTALELNPSFPAAHRVLADYFEKSRQPDLAARHRRLATSP